MYNNRSSLFSHPAFDHDFNTFFRLAWEAPERERGVDVKTRLVDGVVMLDFEVPGYTPANLTVVVLEDGKKLQVSGKVEEGKNVDSFSKTYMLNGNHDVDKITSELKYGILTVSVPIKEPQKPTERQVSIQVK